MGGCSRFPQITVDFVDIPAKDEERNKDGNSILFRVSKASFRDVVLVKWRLHRGRTNELSSSLVYLLRETKSYTTTYIAPCNSELERIFARATALGPITPPPGNNELTPSSSFQEGPALYMKPVNKVSTDEVRCFL
jgi:hypothetical protein